MLRQVDYLLTHIQNYKGQQRAYLERVLDSLYSGSSLFGKVGGLTKPDIVQICEEWEFKATTENSLKQHTPTNCQLCQHPENIYQYKITNKITKKFLWIGSSCILKFGIAFIDSNGNYIDDLTTKEDYFRQQVKNLQFEEKMQRLQSVINDLNEGDEFPFNLTVNNLKSGTITIKQFKRIAVMYNNKYGSFIPVELVELFKVNFRLQANKDEVAKMKGWQIVQINCLMSKSTMKSLVSYNQYKAACSFLERGNRLEELEALIKKYEG